MPWLRVNHTRLSRLTAVPRPLFALPVHRPGIPGQPGANASSITLMPLLMERQVLITVHAPDGVRDPVENYARAHIEQDEMPSQEAVFDVVGQCRQGGENSSGHGRVRFSIRVDSVDLVGKLSGVVIHD